MKLEELVDKRLKKYIETYIFPMYDLNGESHNIEHIKKVRKNAFEIAQKYINDNANQEKLNPNIIYVMVVYHDISDHIDRERHHILSANFMYEDGKLDQFLSPEEKEIAKIAIEDHRASSKNKPRNIYGRILLTADRNNCLLDFFIRRINYCIEKHPEYSFEEVKKEVQESSKKKFGSEGYAMNKDYIENSRLTEYLSQLNRIVNDNQEFEFYFRICYQMKVKKIIMKGDIEGENNRYGDIEGKNNRYGDDELEI